MPEPHRVAHARPTRFADTLCLALVLVSAPTLAAEPGRAVPWRDDLAQAQAEARSRNLPLWIQFTGPWCINCRRMDRDAFVHARVLAHARENFVPVKLRADAHESLALNLGLSALPATVIVRPSGEVIVAQQGYADACEFDAFLLAALARDGRTDRLLARDEPRREPGPGSEANPASAHPAFGGAGDAGAAVASAAPVAETPTPAADLVAATEQQVQASEPARVAVESESMPDEPPAMGGFCPVTLVAEHRLVPGRDDLVVRHEGRDFWFADPARRDRFRAAPEAYAPAQGGRSPVSQVERGEIRPGDPNWGVLYRGWLFLCVDGDERAEFLRNPERYARVSPAGGPARSGPGAASEPLAVGRAGVLELDGPRFGFTASALRSATLTGAETRTR